MVSNRIIMEKRSNWVENLMIGIAVLGAAWIVIALVKAFGKKVMVYDCPQCRYKVEWGTKICPRCKTEMEENVIKSFQKYLIYARFALDPPLIHP